MILKGKFNTAKIFTENVEEACIEQIKNLLNIEAFAGTKIRIMPDCHAGKGCTIGFTMDVKDKIVPNLVGVDIGCLDKDTEILTPSGWIKISNYQNEDILIYDKQTDTAYFSKPIEYIKQPCSYFYHIKSKYGLDQMICPQHRMLVWEGSKKRGYKLKEYIAKKFVEHHNSLTKGISGGIKTTFKYSSNNLNYSDTMLKILIMISADGTIRVNKDGTQRIELHLKKQRKINRAKQLLYELNKNFKETLGKDGTTFIYFKGNVKEFTKELSFIYHASFNQLKLIVNEIQFWDGTIKDGKIRYSTTVKENADAIQFAFAGVGIRAGIYTITQKETRNPIYMVYETKNDIVGFPSKKFQAVNSKDGFKYCFITETHYFIIRRNNAISITGNCGMLTVNLEKTKEEINFAKLDAVINEFIPSGFNIREKAYGNFAEWVEDVNENVWGLPGDRVDYVARSIGTLGGGNHFIEIAESEKTKECYLIIHSGSRFLGVHVCKSWQTRAELNFRYEREIPKEIVPDELCWLEGEDLRCYLRDMRVCSDYANLNRETIAIEIINNMNWNDSPYLDKFHTVHNYIGDDNIIRKGAISAKRGEKLLIPLNMRDGSLLCVGKSNPEWNYSAPHGAGRVFSRKQAKKKLSLDEFKKDMEGIYTTSVCEKTLDEAPEAYKQGIEELVGDTVKVIDRLKTVYNFKAK